MEDVPVVRASTAIVQLCGPIVEIVNKTPQFVHFTVKEYVGPPLASKANRAKSLPGISSVPKL